MSKQKTIYVGTHSEQRRKELGAFFSGFGGKVCELENVDMVQTVLCEPEHNFVVTDVDFIGVSELEILSRLTEDGVKLPLAVFHEPDQQSISQGCQCFNFTCCRSYAELIDLNWEQLTQDHQNRDKESSNSCLFVDAAELLFTVSMMNGCSQEQLEKLFRNINSSVLAGGLAHFLPFDEGGLAVFPHFSYKINPQKITQFVCLEQAIRDGFFRGMVGPELADFVQYPELVDQHCLIVTVAGDLVPMGFILLVSPLEDPINQYDEKVIRSVANVMTMNMERAVREVTDQEERASLEQEVQRRTRDLEETNQRLLREADERKKVKKRLKKSEAYYRSLIEYASDLISVIDRDGKIIFHSPGVERNLGYQLEEVKGTSSIDIVHHEEQEKIRAELTKVIENPAYISKVQYRVLTHDKRWVLHEAVVRNLLDDEVVNGIIINSWDITERTRSDRILRNILEGTSAATGSQFYQLLVKYLAASLDMDGAILLVKPVLMEPDLRVRAVWWDNGYIREWDGEDGRVFILGDDGKEVVFRQNLHTEINQNHPVSQAGIDALMAVPVILSNGSLAGYIAVVNRKDIAYDAENIATLNTFAARVGAELSRDHAEKELYKQANYDLLTNLPNRRYFTESLSTALRILGNHPNYKVSLLFLDMDRFKVINDSLGHMIGDKLLIAVSERLLKLLPEQSVFARLSGDEFAILFEGPQAQQLSISYADIICDVFAHAFEVESFEVYTSVSIGVAHAVEQGINQTELLRNADNAMYAAKSHGRNQWKVYDKFMHSMAMKTFHLENDLKGALDRSEFVLEYQPIVNLATGKMIGAEALIRWNHPQRGFLKPDDFLEICEETGYIVSIDRWVLKQVLDDLSTLEKIPQNFRINVNFSGIHMMKQDMASNYIGSVLESGIPAQHIGLEITEGALMQHDEYIIRSLHKIKKLGSPIVIDDFGVGYSSLARLHTLPINDVKIDKSFVDAMGPEGHETEALWAIVTLAHNMGLGVVAEGIESVKQAETLRVMQCGRGQGYHFSESIPFSCIKALLEEKNTLTEQVEIISNKKGIGA
ncbi:MAG: sensor domain-containing protein [bacterium]